MSLALIAWRNLFRNLLRASMTSAGVAVAVLAFLLIRTVLTSWNAAADYAAQDRLGTRHKVSFVISLPKNYIDTVRQVPGVTAASFASWFGGKDPRQPNLFFAKLAVDSETFFDVMNEMKVPPEQLQAWKENRRGVILGDVIAGQLGLKPGDRITIEGDIYPGNWEFEIVGIYEATRKSVDRATFIFHWNYLNESLPEGRRDTIGWIMTRVAEPGLGPDVSKRIDSIFEEKDAQTLTMSERAMNLSFMGMLSAILSALDVVSIIILLIMMLILGNTIAMGVRERTHEYGVLRALGFAPKHIATFIVGEALLLGLVGGGLGLLLSYPLVTLGMGRWLEENMGQWFPYFRLTPGVAAAGLGLAVALAGLASIIPALTAARLQVTDALRRVG